jgi:hypothetical protein
MNVVMSQSERLRHIQEQATKYVSRNKCVDSSLMTLVVQSKASQTAAPQKVAAVVDRADCPTNATVVGKGTNGEYIGIMQKAQGCAICPSSGITDTGAYPKITLPVPCVNEGAPPFTQQNMSSFYTQPCTNPGNLNYFPPPVYDGPGCTFNRITTPSA